MSLKSFALGMVDALHEDDPIKLQEHLCFALVMFEDAICYLPDQYELPDGELKYFVKSFRDAGYEVLRLEYDKSMARMGEREKVEGNNLPPSSTNVLEK
jgi:hypothetical protein